MRHGHFSCVLTLLAAVMCAQLCSCGGERAAQDTGTTSAASEALSESIGPVLPKVDLGGKNVVFLYREASSTEFCADSMNGDVVNDAIYESFRAVEDALNVSLETRRRPGDTTSDRDEYLNHITATVLNGDSTYDWCDTLIGLFPGLVTEGYFADLLENKYLDFDADYWIAGQAETCAPTGKLYFASGDSSLGYLRSAYCLFYNTSLAQRIGLEDVYKTVEDGKWTLDKLGELARGAARDDNGDGALGLGDTIGFAVHDYTHPRAFHFSTGGKFFGDKSGKLSFVYGSEKDHSLVEKLNKLFYDAETSYYYNGSNANTGQLEGYNAVTSAFVSGHILLITAEFDHAVSQLRDMDDNYGILPCPKYDEAQSDYITVSRSTHNAFAMPITCADPDAAGAALEALSAYKYTTVLPAYFEIALKVKYSRDEATSRMCDIIRQSMALEFGFVFNNVLGNPIVTAFEPGFKTPGSFMSSVAAQRESVDTLISEYMEKLAAVGKNR